MAGLCKRINEPFTKAAECAGENSLQKGALRLSTALETPVLPAIHDGKILLLSSKGNLELDLAEIRRIRSATPDSLILLIDVSGDETNFLQCIRAGVRGYLPRDASAEDVVEAVKSIHGGKAVCPGTLCAALFRYIEHEATMLPFRERPSAPGPYPARAATHSAGCRRPHQQGNREPLL